MALGTKPSQIGNITTALEAKGMLENSVIVVSTDNGGPTDACAAIGASNFPLRQVLDVFGAFADAKPH